MDNYTRLDEHLMKLREDSGYIEYFKTLFIENSRLNPKYTKSIMEKVLQVCKECDYKVAYAWCLTYIGWYYSDCCELTTSIKYNTEAKEIFSKYDEIEGLIWSHNALLVNYYKLGMFDLAIEYGLDGINIVEQSGREELLTGLLLNTASAYIDSGYHKEALELINRLNHVYHEISDENKIIMYNLLTEIHLLLGELQAAGELCKKSYKLIKKYNLEFLECDTLALAAEIYYKSGMYEEADINFNIAVKMADSFGFIDTKIKSLIRWSRYYSFIEDFDNAKSKLEEAKKDVEKVNSNLLFKEIYNELSIIYSKTENYKEAFFAKEKYCEYEKNIFNQNISLWFAVLHSKQITQEAKTYKSLYNQIDIISEIGKRITSNLKKKSTFNSIYEEVNILLKADVLGIALYNEGSKILKYEFLIENGEMLDCPIVKTDNNMSFAAYCVNNKKDIIINDLSKEYENYTDPYKGNKKKGMQNLTQSLIFCPLMKDGNVIGILNVQSYAKNAYSREDLSTLKILKSYITIAVENSKLFDRVNYLAKNDSLTGVLNRREILKVGKKNLNNSILKEQNMSIIMLDIDYFKHINDTYGHQIGDHILRKVVSTIRSELEEKYIVGRYGGEEFLIILPNTDIKECYSISEKLRKVVEKYNYTIKENKKIRVTISLGICTIEDSSLSFFEAVKLADEALYKSKQEGRNKTSINNK